MTKKTVKIPLSQLLRIKLAFSDTLPVGVDRFDNLVEKIEKRAMATKGETATLTAKEVSVLCELFGMELDIYSEVLYSFAKGDVLDYVPLLDYVEDLACICEGLQYLLNNADFQRHFYEMHHDLLQKQRAKKEGGKCR